MTKEYYMFPLNDIMNATPIKNIVGSVDGVRLTDKGAFIFPAEFEVTPQVIQDFIKLHKNYRLPKLLESHFMYHGEHAIKVLGRKDNSICEMPDNRLVVNFSKYITDTFNGYFIGIPPKITNDNDSIDDSMQEFFKRSELSDNLAELSKITSIYGSGFAYLYQGQDSKTYMTYNSPLDMFVVYDDTLEQNPLFAVRFWENQIDKKTYDVAEVYIGADKLRYSTITGEPMMEPYQGYNAIYPSLPVIEFVENDARQSIFESVKTLIDEYNKAISEKANDVEYFANAYLKILGASVENGTLTAMQKNRVINAVGQGSQSVEIDFIQKPDADTSQENLLNRLTDLIFIISMVANTTDDDYGDKSGTALEFKLQDMRNMRIAKERKFTSGLTQMYKLWFGIPLNVPSGLQNEYVDNKYIFTENVPHNTKEEIENAKNLEGIVTKETQIGQLSFVDDVKSEIENQEKEAAENLKKMQEAAGMSPENNPNSNETNNSNSTENNAVSQDRNEG